MTQQVSNRPNIRNISNFKEKLAGGGARPNIFEVSIPDFPDFAKNQWDNNTRLTFNLLCKAAALPASNVAPIDVPFRGRILKVAGDRTFDTWTVTIINDEDFKIRHAFEVWMNGINKLDNATGATNPSTYMRDAFVYQLGRSGKVNGVTAVNDALTTGSTGEATVLRSYKFFDIFPTNISQIDLSYETSDTIEEFNVEFQVQYYEINGGPGNIK